MGRNVLLIAYEFPPLASSGMYRAFQMTKYLTATGWNVYVLTGNPKEFSLGAFTDDLGMQIIIPANRIFRSGMADRGRTKDFIKTVHDDYHLKDIFHCDMATPFPDIIISWLPCALPTALEIIHAHAIDVIVTTSFPFSSALLGFLLHSTTGLPWVAEFRDLWTADPRFPKENDDHLVRSNRLEKIVLEEADIVVATSEPLTESLFNSIGHSREKFHTIPLTYDPDDFPDNEPLKMDIFSLVHIGTIYPGMIPPNLIQAIDLLQKLGKLKIDKYEFILAGTDFSGRASYFKSLGYTVTGYITHRDVVSYYQRAALLVITLPPLLKDFIPSRIFEYMASQRPVFALTPENSVLANLIHSSRCGVVLDYCVPFDAIANILYDMYIRWKEKDLFFTPDNGFIKQFSSPIMMKHYCNILNSIILKGIT
jgi:glycosyltransferase involved in cell wall biosynthesis